QSVNREYSLAAVMSAGIPRSVSFSDHLPNSFSLRYPPATSLSTDSLADSLLSMAKSEIFIGGTLHAAHIRTRASLRLHVLEKQVMHTGPNVSSNVIEHSEQSAPHPHAVNSFLPIRRQITQRPSVTALPTSKALLMALLATSKCLQPA